jgi:nitrate/TMAO reductase-like tetraheme cytochrome c subunit
MSRLENKVVFVGAEVNGKSITFLFLLVVVAVTLLAANLLQERSSENVVTAANLYPLSAHANEDSHAFTYWHDDEPPVIPADCARCHSPLGFMDYLGEDGSQAGTVAQDHPIGRAITCLTCHNNAAHTADAEQDTVLWG